MKKAAFFSALLHCFFLLSLIITIPDFKNQDILWTPVPVEMVDIAEISQSPAPIQKPQPQKETPKPEQKKETTPKPVDPPKPLPAPEREKADAISDPQPTPDPVPEPLPKKIEPTRKKEAPLPKPRKKPAKTKTKKPANDFESVLKDLTDIKDRVEKKEKIESSDSSSRSSGDPGPKITMSELDAVRRQIQACWNLPAGAKEGSQLIVDIRVFMNADGTVRDARLLSSSKGKSNPFYRTASESALRAIRDPRCQPFLLPKRKYEQWKVFVISFNPKDLL